MARSKPSANPPVERSLSNRPDYQATHGSHDATPVSPRNAPQGVSPKVASESHGKPGGSSHGFAGSVSLARHEGVYPSRCYLKPYAADHRCVYRADGQADKAHLIPQQRLKQHGLESLCEDPRSYVYACRKHHHALDHGFLTLRLEDHPPRFLDFARENDLFWTERGWRVASPRKAGVGEERV